MTTTRRASLEELRSMRDRGETAAPRADAPAVDLPDGFWDEAEVRMPARKQALSLRVDPDIIAFFKEGGDGYLTRMHAVLRAYVDAKRRQDAPR